MSLFSYMLTCDGGFNFAQMCVLKSEGQGSFFGFKQVKWVIIFHSGEILCWLLYIITHESGENELQWT